VITNRITIRLLFAASALALILALPAPALATARVDYLQGTVHIGSTDSGPWQPLQKGMTVTANKFIKTGKNGYVELTLPDRSIVRLAPGTLFELEESFFPKNKPRRFSARLLLGKIWARVSRKIGSQSDRFNTRTPTAVAGVRGTVYDLRTAADKSTDIRVHTGRVAVGPALVVAGGPKEEIAWPQQVTEQKWEEIILGKLQKLHIGPDGKPGKPTSFDPQVEKDEWTDWNMERDKNVAE
jgi:hypothetical protein